MTWELALLALLALTLGFVVAFNYIKGRRRNRQIQADKARKTLVSPPTYIGPITLSRMPEDSNWSFLDSIPRGYIQWVKLLLENTALDEGAGYFYNENHGSVVLHTRLTAEELLETIKTQTGFVGEAATTISNGKVVYRWIAFSLSSEEAQEVGVHPYHRMIIEIRGLYP